MSRIVPLLGNGTVTVVLPGFGMSLGISGDRTVCARADDTGVARPNRSSAATLTTRHTHERMGLLGRPCLSEDAYQVTAYGSESAHPDPMPDRRGASRHGRTPFRRFLGPPDSIKPGPGHYYRLAKSASG